MKTKKEIPSGFGIKRVRSVGGELSERHSGCSGKRSKSASSERKSTVRTRARKTDTGSSDGTLRRKALVCFAAFMIWSLAGCGTEKEEHYRIGVLQWSEDVSEFVDTYDGVVKGLADNGYRVGLNLELEYVNVEQDKKKAREAAEAFVREGVDLIVALGTGSALAALEATGGKKVAIVYSIVTAPKATGIIKDYEDPGAEITGVTMRVSTEEQFRIVKEAFPDLKKLGIIYCTEMPQAVFTGKEAAEVGKKFGWETVSVSFPKEELDRLGEKVVSLLKEVDVLYLPSDPFLAAPQRLRVIIQTADAVKKPVIGITGRQVKAGALLATHCDFHELGRQAAVLAMRVLRGASAETIPSQRPTLVKLSLNLKKAKELGLKIKRNIVLRADVIMD